MDNEYIQALRKEVKKEFTADKARYWHTIGVAETSACLAMRYGVDMQKAFTAGLLHDCAKCLDKEHMMKIAQELPLEEKEISNSKCNLVAVNSKVNKDKIVQTNITIEVQNVEILNKILSLL